MGLEWDDVEVVPTGVVKNSQKLDRFFTGLHFGHKKKVLES
jgi:hypothetical protein